MFSQDSQFRQTFGRHFVREEVLIASLKQLSVMLSDLGNSTGKDGAPPTLTLVLSRVAFDFSQHLAQSLVSNQSPPNSFNMIYIYNCGFKAFSDRGAI